MSICKPEIKSEPLEIIEGSASFPCPICGGNFFSEKDFVEHIKEHKSAKNSLVKQEITAKTEEVIVKIEPAFYHDSNGLNQCDKEDLFHANLRPEKLFGCTLCSFATNAKFSLDRHQRIHTGEKPFKCTQCSYAAAHKHLLVKHQQTHKGNTF